MNFLKKPGLFTPAMLLFFVAFQVSAQSSVVPKELRCEYLINPEGIDEPIPRLSWLLSARDENAFGQSQSACQIIVSSTPSLLQAGKGDLWNSGWMHTADFSQIPYTGKPLVSGKAYYWKVRVKDEKARISAWSPAAHWGMGPMKQSDWTASWIGSGEQQDPNQKDCSLADPWLRKSFRLSAHPGRAIMYVASVGFHELYVNGKKVSDGVLAPAVSNHRKRARYIAYDIGTMLRTGDNTIGIWLGTGWSIYSSYKSADKPLAPIVIAQVDIHGAGQGPVRIQTDESWKWHPSPNRMIGSWAVGNMGGEWWNTNEEIPGWSNPGLKDKGWKNVTVYHPNLVLSAQLVEPNKLFHEIHPISVAELPDGAFRVDMGVNFAGFTEMKCKGKPGDKLEFLFSERQQDSMTFKIRSALTLGPDGTGVFRNRFNYSSGRWITIKGAKEKPRLEDIRGWVVRTAYSPASTFSCSDSLQNWIYDRVKWNFENLSLGGYVVDCPQRERLGYGGDAHATSETGLLNYKLAAFYSKWMEDWRDVQGVRDLDPASYAGKADEGILPHTAPTFQGGGGPAWGGISITLPWLMYEQQGDKRILERNFELIEKWLLFLDSHVKDGLLQRYGGGWDYLGDWLWPNATAEGMNTGKPENSCFNNLYRVYNLRTAAKIARIIGRHAAAARWEELAAISGKAIHQQFFNVADTSYADGSMANLALALLAEVPPPGLRKPVLQRLEKEILEVRKGHIHAGITGGAMLFELLRQEGRDDLLYSMTSQTAYPGWGFMKANGATSIWEMWEKDLAGHSLLHSSFLYPGAWYIDGLSGIRKDRSAVAFRKFIVRPPALKEGQLSWCKTSFDSPSGTIKVHWERKNDQLSLSVTVPPGAQALVYFPAAPEAPIHLSSPLAKKTGYENGHHKYTLTSGTFVFSERF